jgi:hypothetical protein
LYFSNGSWSKEVYAFDITDTELPITAVINKSFYGLGVHNGYVFGTVVPSFTESGWSYKYNASGTVIDSVEVGVGPNGYCFN